MTFGRNLITIDRTSEFQESAVQNELNATNSLNKVVLEKLSDTDSEL